MKCLSYNLEGMGNPYPTESNHNVLKRKLLKELLEKGDYDIICLQEVTPAVFPVLDSTVYELIHYPDPGSTGSSNFNVIYIKRVFLSLIVGLTAENSTSTSVWGVESASALPSGEYNGIFTEVIDCRNDKSYFIASFHLPPFRDASIARQTSIKSLLETIKERMLQGSTVIIAGDTNAMAEYDLKLLNGKENTSGLKDIWIDTGSADKEKYTYNNDYFAESKRKRRMRYDRAFISDKAVVGSFRVVGRESYSSLITEERPSGRISDHYGIEFTI